MCVCLNNDILQDIIRKPGGAEIMSSKIYMYGDLVFANGWSSVQKMFENCVYFFPRILFSLAWTLKG